MCEHASVRVCYVYVHACFTHMFLKLQQHKPQLFPFRLRANGPMTFESYPGNPGNPIQNEKVLIDQLPLTHPLFGTGFSGFVGLHVRAGVAKFGSVLADRAPKDPGPRRAHRKW